MNNQKTIKIGWSKKDITPYNRTVSLAGQGNMRVTNKVRDSIYVTALVIGRRKLPSCNGFMRYSICAKYHGCQGQKEIIRVKRI